MGLPASLTIVTSVSVPVVAVTTTRATGSTLSAPGAGVMVSWAGAGAGAAACGDGPAATVWQRFSQSGSIVTATPPSTASTASTAATQAPRTRRSDVKETPVSFGKGREDREPDRVHLRDRVHSMVPG
jgi:hypothetical protein